ncbi:DUF58 domain-containing protein [Natronorubrum sulfidifaciens]|uniref:DUF58 domain-containing protein n=1 Tax=Natronorubrum sulfidifaciens JCM 14089 TaxID=1230460 RepID=L9W731_9EURY|nr:DUF58 domain-containing protein [Natronorubrum sulfidifaciens]ELY45147.1 hypothetical protein C495_09400 [Natronorubrum sulfidifaciens JCM 14089]
MTDTSRQARWQAALVGALLSSLLAVVLGVPALLFLAVVGLGFVLVGQASSIPTLGAGADTAAPETDAETAAVVRLERSLEETRVRPGESVTVTLSVTNEGTRVLPDVRIADEPPADVAVTRGSPVFATAVSPGETVTHEYELTPPRGEHEFGTTTLRLRSLPATAITTDEREPGGDTSLTCETLLDSIPFQDRTIQFVGQTPTDDGGSGIEFFSTRDYRRGDPINRIDWHRFARTGDLATVEYREERAVTIVFVIDDRLTHHRETPGGGPDSFDLTLYAASRGVVASLEEGNRTGLAMLSGSAWVEPGAGRGVRRRIDDVVDDGHAVADGGDYPSSERAGDDDSLAVNLERRLPRQAQVALCTPLLDDDVVALVETLRTRGRAVTVITPDVTDGLATTTPSMGARIAGLERANRIDALRGIGVTVADWSLEEPISIALARAFRAGAGGGSA